MALTKGTTWPIAPTALSSGGNRQGPCLMTFPVLASETYKPGGIVVLASGLADSVDAGQSDGVVLGVCMPKGLAFQTTDALHTQQSPGATVDFPDKVLVALALPGAFFAGNVTIGAATNYTANTATIIGTAQMDSILGTDAWTGYLLINSSITNAGQIRLIRYNEQQVNKTTGSPISFPSFGNTDIVNPRVDFVFRCSAFQPIV